MGVIISGLQDIQAQLKRTAEKAHEAILTALDKAGQRLVEQAKATKQYQDQTGNLTASIGYGVYSNGVEQSTGGFGGGVGEERGREYLAEVAPQYRASKYVLIVVAGMEYAVAVERRGRVVLDGALVVADSVVESELNSIKL